MFWVEVDVIFLCRSFLVFIVICFFLFSLLFDFADVSP